MKISLDWLKSYVDLDGLAVEPLSHALTMVGFEVEGVEHVGLAQLDNVVVGKIVSFDKHPNADRLSLCQVDVGDGELRSIVCGAKNFAAGDHVIAALPGAVLPGDFKIKVSKLRGVESQGMLCSERELGIGEDHAGIAILKDKPALGTPVNDLYPAPDLVFDIEITPNRPDALSHIGIARELAAWFQRPLRYPDLEFNPLTVSKQPLISELVVENDMACPHYRGYSIAGVTTARSPAWLRRRLEAVGLRPINNIVDITNYVLLETGQPLHAFDVSKIRGGKILVRMADDGERIVTLDDKERKLCRSDLVIADAERALVVAGVMGSVDAEVDDATTDIFLEAAYFKPVGVRRTSKRLGLSTDSSYRFERGVDPKGAEYAALRCIDLITRMAGGEVVGQPLVAGEPPLAEQEVELDPSWVRGCLGFAISDADMIDCLSRLELNVREDETAEGQLLLRVGIPSFRLDLYRPVDLVEEVLRMYGCDRIPEGGRSIAAIVAEDSAVTRFERAANRMLVGRGLYETCHYTLREEDETRLWFGHANADCLRIANPLASDASHLRVSLIPGLLDCLRLNQSRHQHAFGLFETGRVFRELNGSIQELVSVAWVIPQRDGVDFALVKRMMADLLAAAGLEFGDADVQALEDAAVWQSGHSGGCGGLASGHEGRFGMLDLGVTKRWDIDQPVYAGSLAVLPEVLLRPRPRRSYQPISQFPPALRDVALVVAADTPAGRVLRRVGELVDGLLDDGLVLESVDVFDVYTGKGVVDGHKSIALQLCLRHPSRTLNDKEVNALLQQLLTALDKEPGMEVRR
jgi:phenylalanyl-tRNA synthetase beta chain